MNDLYTKALEAYDSLKELGEGQQDFDWHGAYVDHFCAYPGDEFFAIEEMIFDFSDGNITLKKPTQKGTF